MSGITCEKNTADPKIRVFFDEKCESATARPGRVRRIPELVRLFHDGLDFVKPEIVGRVRLLLLAR